MERQRCTDCHEPLTGEALAWTSRAGREWLFHPGCFEQVRAAEQRGYEDSVQSDGLGALIAPYLCTLGELVAAEPAGAVAVPRPWEPLPDH